MGMSAARGKGFRPRCVSGRVARVFSGSSGGSEPRCSPWMSAGHAHPVTGISLLPVSVDRRQGGGVGEGPAGRACNLWHPQVRSRPSGTRRGRSAEGLERPPGRAQGLCAGTRARVFLSWVVGKLGVAWSVCVWTFRDWDAGLFCEEGSPFPAVLTMALSPHR